MSKTGQHIISRFRWHTTFDDREKANELQSRISAWSRLEMQREIEAIFDRFCPPGKVWSIPSLELDLGEVDFSSLEPGLSRRIKQQLMAKLEELVLQQQASNGNEELVVSDVRDAGLRFLRHYLLHGVKPWNDTDGRRNINDILEEQWTAGSDAVMEMLHDIAGNSREVRRRMAWQVAEPNIIAIVQKMEPANCDVIVEFRNSMVAVQEKETIVQAAAGDFKKNLWFWILNYLFTMHGSLFNKKEFLKSTIRQMAAHFNIQYEELLRLVMQLAGKLNHIHGRHKEFLVVLNMIASEVSPEAGEDNTVFNVTETTPRRLLKEYFLQKTYAPSPAGKKELNELVCSMAQKDVSWFRSFLQTIKYPHSAWTNILDDLDEASLSAIFTVWNTGAGKMIQSIHFLTALCRNSNIGITRNTLWEAGLGILAQQGGSIPQPRKVLGLMVEKLERVTRLPAVALLEKLIVNETAASYTAFQTVMLRHLQREYAAKISLLPAGEDQLHITMLLQQLSRNDITTAEKQKAEQRLLFFLQTHPAASVKTIMAFDDKQGLEKIIHGTITEQLARKLLPQLPREKVTLLWQLHDLLAVSSQGNMGYTISPAASILPVMLAQGVQEMMTDAAATLPVFLETLLEKVYKAIPAGAATAFGSMVSRFLNGREMPARSVPVALKEKLLRRYAYITPEMAADHILHTVLHTPHRQEEISRLLTRYSRNRSVMALRNHNHAAAAKVINYLLPQGVVIKEKLVAAYARAIARYYPAYINTAIIRRLGEVFWNTIVQYGVYQGNVNAFSKIFYTAVLFNFPLLKEELGMGNKELGIGSSDEPVVENGIGEKGKREKETGTGNDDGHTIENGISQSANPQSANPQSANRQPLGEELGIGNEELGIGSSDDSSTETNIPLTSNRQPLNEELGISRSDEPVVENGIGEKGKREKETGKGNDDAHTIENGISQSAHPQSAVPLTSNRQPLNGELGIGNEELGISRSDEPVVENGIGEKGKREKGTGNDDDHTIENGVSQSANPQSANSQFVPQSSLLLAEQCLNNTENAITFNNISYSFSTIWNGLLRTAPRLLVQLIRQYPLTPQRHKMIAGTGSITAVIPWILPELNNRAAMQASAIQHIYEYATALLPAAAKEKLQQEYWQALWTLIRQNGLPAKTVERLADAALHPLVLEQSKNILSLWTYWEEKQPWFLPVIKRSLQRTGKAPHGFDTAPVKNRPGIQLFRSGQAAWINVLLKTAISTKQVPLWFPHHEPGYTAADLLNDALLYFPAACFRFFSTEKNTAVQLEWLTQNIDTQVLVNAVRQLEPGRQQQLDMILQCISASMFTGGSKTWGGITQAQVQKIISGKIFTAWTTGNWRILSPQWFWQELSWTLHTKYGVLEKRLFMDVERNAASLPAPFRKAFERLFLQYRERKMPQPAPLPEPRKKISTMNKPQSFPAKEGITVFNAGLVIVNSYILLLFDRLGITSGNKFVSEQAQLDAVHLLQYIVTGHSHTEEHFLPLNKFLCGLDIAHPVPDGIEILESTRSMIDGLIKAVIGYWPAIGDTSVDGFRGNWLVRKGVLTDGDEKWELTVEKRTYDILLNRSPFSFSVIKLPWMERPLHVTWPF